MPTTMLPRFAEFRSILYDAGAQTERAPSTSASVNAKFGIVVPMSCTGQTDFQPET
ncbi:MAG: hypothetical protein ABJL13_10440 [Tateyamaria sp.]